MPSTDDFALRRSGLGEFLFAAVGTEANGMTLRVSVFARLGNDPWQEAARLADLPKSQAIERLARIIAGMPTSVWQLPAATALANSLIALLPSQSGKSGYNLRASAAATKAGHALRVGFVVLIVAFAGAFAPGVFTTVNAPNLDGNDVASFAKVPH
jgi:hypothetical protein